ncbi:MAG TPA: hypothetical protein VIJ66_02160 [Solirubrobacteraceae bacterium]
MSACVSVGMMGVGTALAAPSALADETYFNGFAANNAGGHSVYGYIGINQGEGFEGSSCINEYQSGGGGTEPKCAGKNSVETDDYIDSSCHCTFLGYGQVWNIHGSPAHIWGWARFI